MLGNKFYNKKHDLSDGQIISIDLNKEGISGKNVFFVHVEDDKKAFKKVIRVLKE
jgi:hypothetical protein